LVSSIFRSLKNRK